MHGIEQEAKYLWKMKSTHRKLPKSLTEEEFKQLIIHTRKSNKEARIAFLLAYGAGMRISEVKACRKEHFAQNSIEIRDSKYGVDRVVPIPKGWKEWMFACLPIQKSVRSLERNFKTVCKKAKLNPQYVFHSLRHGFATRLMERGVPLSHIQIMMGHSSIQTTGIYLRARPQDALKSYEELF